MRRGRLIVRCVVFFVVGLMMTGCGSTFKNVNTACIDRAASLSASQRIGVLVVGVDRKKSTKVAERHLVGALRDSGMNAHTVEQTGAVTNFLLNYGMLSRSAAEGINSPCTADMGNLNKIFEDEGIDSLLVYDGTYEDEVTVLGTLVGFADTAADVGLSIAAKTVISRDHPAQQTYRSVTANHLTLITPDGRISRYVSGALPRQGGMIYESERAEIAKQLAEILMGNGRIKEAGLPQ